MNDYQQKLTEILTLLDELEYAKEIKKWNKIITEAITKISEHISLMSTDNVADTVSEYVENINSAKEELEFAKRNPKNSKLHLGLAKESLKSAKDTNWQMMED